MQKRKRIMTEYGAPANIWHAKPAWRVSAIGIIGSAASSYWNNPYNR